MAAGLFEVMADVRDLSKLALDLFAYSVFGLEITFVSSILF